jgi:hypothetical protein
MSRVAGTQYTIAAPTRRCAAVGREFAVGEPFVAVLAQSRESEEFVRLDYSTDAWTTGARPERAMVVLGFWRAVMSEPGAKRKLLIDDQSLVELFEQSGEEGEGDGAERAAFRYVLALILLRKRLIVQEGSKGKGGRTMLVRIRGNPRPPEGPAYLEVADPGLDEAAIVRVTDRLGAVLNDDAPAHGAARGGET